MKDPEVNHLGKGRFALDLPNYRGLGSSRVVVSRRVLAKLIRVSLDSLDAHPAETGEADSEPPAR